MATESAEPTGSKDIIKTYLKYISINNGIMDPAVVILDSSNLHCWDLTLPWHPTHSLEIGFSE
jgi:hypothetical protein